MDEEKTMIRFFDSNGIIGYEETTEDLKNKDILKMLGMMELAKMQILNRLDEEFRAEEE